MTSTNTIINLMTATAEAMDAVPTPDPTPGLMFAAVGARFERGREQHRQLELGVQRILAAAESLSVVQRAKLDDMLCRAGQCEERSADHDEDEIVQTAYPLTDVLGGIQTAAQLRHLVRMMTWDQHLGNQNPLAAGDQVEAGAFGTADFDVGTVLQVDGETSRALVGWRTGVNTWTALGDLRRHA